MNKYTLYWLDGKREIIDGIKISDAFMRAGYSNGALQALDFHAIGDCDKWIWDKEKHKWIKKQ